MPDFRDQRDYEAELNRVSGEHPAGYHRRFEEDEGKTVLPSTHRFAVLTCMDARVEASKLVGQRGSEGHVIRNAGGRATEDSIRSLVLSYKLLGTREWFIVQHSHCGMALLTEDLSRELLQSPRPAGNGTVKISVPSPRETGAVPKIALRDQHQSVASDVARIRNHPLVPTDVLVYGYIFNVETGRFVEVPASRENMLRSVRSLASLSRAG